MRLPLAAALLLGCARPASLAQAPAPGTPGAAQAAAAQPLAIPGGETFLLDAPAQTYRVHVTLPPDYRAEGDAYPVLYYADAWWLTETVAGAHRLAVLTGNAQPAILVGVGLDGDEAAWNVQRNRDLTPTPIGLPPGVTIEVSGVPMNAEGTGGAPAFAQFLRETLVPRVEADYNASAEGRGWLGHSLGGLFGAWAEQTEPELFSRLLLIAPAVWWDRGAVVTAGFGAPEAGSRTFVAYGSAEDAPILEWAPPLAEALEAAGHIPTLQVYEGADHHSLLPQAIWDGLVALYGAE